MPWTLLHHLYGHNKLADHASVAKHTNMITTSTANDEFVVAKLRQSQSENASVSGVVVDN